MFWATLTAGVIMTTWSLLVTNTGGLTSAFLVKVVPFFIGVWCLFECGRVLI